MQPVLIPDAVAVDNKRSKDAGVGAVDAFHPLGSAQLRCAGETAAGRSGNENEDIRAIQPKQVGR